MLKVIEGLIKLLGNEKLWTLIGILVQLLEKRGEIPNNVEDYRLVKTGERPIEIKIGDKAK